MISFDGGHHLSNHASPVIPGLAKAHFEPTNPKETGEHPVLNLASATQTVPAAHRNFERLHTIEQRFNERLIGQPEAVKQVCDMTKRIITGFYDPNRPFGVLLFAGPTGVGKTEMAKLIAEEFDIPLHRFDMSEFSHESSISRFLGSPPGYKDSEKSGDLIKAIKKDPVCVVLFDEIEKAHSETFKLFLQLFDEGRLTDAMGNIVMAKNVIFILTTNLGSHEICYHIQNKTKADLDSLLNPLFIKKFSPELFNRFQKIIVFKPLDYKTIAWIAQRYMDLLADSVFKQKRVILTWDDSFIGYIAKLRSDPQMGARGIQRQVNDFALSVLSENYISGKFSDGDKILCRINPRYLGKIDIEVLEKGKIDPVNEQKVMYFDSRGQPAKNFIGTFAIRTGPCGNDRSFFETPGIILNVSPDGNIIIHDGVMMSSELTLSSEWNDDKWMLAPPSADAKKFFLGLCLKIDQPGKRGECLKLVTEIFNETHGLCHYLSNDDPIGDLRSRTALEMNLVDFPKKIDLLEKHFGRIKVVDQAALNKLSTRHYDLKLHSKL